MTARHAREILAVAGICFLSPFLHAQTLLQIVTESLPSVTAGTPYNQPLVTSGGNCSTIGSASSTIDDGNLPPGISVTSGASVKQWSLQGVPSTAGTFRFTVHLLWTLTRTSPFQQPCVDEATKTLTILVDPSQTLVADRTQVTTLYHTGTFPPPNDTVKVSSTGARRPSPFSRSQIRAAMVECHGTPRPLPRPSASATRSAASRPGPIPAASP
jgi:hypothetical protein